MNLIDKNRLARNFSRAAEGYDIHARLQYDIGQALIDMFPQRLPEGTRILDIGMGTGWLDLRIAEKYPDSEITGLDIAPKMVETAIRRAREAGAANMTFLEADMDNLGFPEGSFDFLISNLALQWSNDTRAALKSWYKTASSGAWFYCSTIGDGTMREWRESWDKASGQLNLPSDWSGPVFLSINEFINALTVSGFKIDDYKVVEKINSYPDPIEALHSFHQIGAGNAIESGKIKLSEREKRQRLKLAMNIYERDYATKGGIPLTYEVFIVNAHK